MTEIIKEYFHSSRGEVRIDRELGIIFGVKILGVQSRNKRMYPKTTLENAIPLYENAKVNLDHPEGDPRKPRSYQDRFGMIRNVRFQENDGLYADFHFNPRHSIAEQLLWDAENAPENVGFSHNVEALLDREKESDIVREIVSVRSVDLVADPATTKGLFESLSQEPPEIEILKNELSSAKRKIAALESAMRATEQAFRNSGNHLCELLSEAFIESLVHLPDDNARERMIKDRTALLEKLERPLATPNWPVSREQSPIRSGESSTKSFLDSILGR